MSGFTEKYWQHGMEQVKGPGYGTKPAQEDKIVSLGSGKTQVSVVYGQSK